MRKPRKVSKEAKSLFNGLFDSFDNSIDGLVDTSDKYVEILDGHYYVEFQYLVDAQLALKGASQHNILLRPEVLNMFEKIGRKEWVPEVFFLSPKNKFMRALKLYGTYAQQEIYFVKNISAQYVHGEGKSDIMELHCSETFLNNAENKLWTVEGSNLTIFTVEQQRERLKIGTATTITPIPAPSPTPPPVKTPTKGYVNKSFKGDGYNIEVEVKEDLALDNKVLAKIRKDITKFLKENSCTLV